MNDATGERAASHSLESWIPRKLRRWRERLEMLMRRDSLKYASEVAFWQNYWEESGGHFSNAYYRKLMLAMSGREGDEFLRGKAVADFGCGPRGSLCWATTARQRVGIDVLVDRYMKFGIADHDMCYVRSSEREIPLPTGWVDVLYTVNALDHVSHLSAMCQELVRILAPGGEFFGSFNLNEPRAACEPQTLTQPILRRHLLGDLDVSWYGIIPKRPENSYEEFFRCQSRTVEPVGPAILWIRAVKRA